MAKTKYPYNPLYCEQIVDFFSPPYYTIKDMTITKSDGTQIDKTEMEALPPLFLSDFGRSIGVKRGYRQLFSYWSKKHTEFADALKEAKELEIERVRTNALMGLYHGSFSIFTMKNIASWKDAPLIDLSKHTHYQFEYKKVDENTIRASQSSNGSLGTPGKVESSRSGEEIRKNIISGSRTDEEGTKPTKS